VLSILIRNLNEGQSLKQTLYSLKRQQMNFEYEVVVIDNESEDSSVKIARQFGCKVFTLKREAFTFGYALNYGIEKCKGEIILILSAHIALVNEFFLQNTPQYFVNPQVAGLRFVQCTATDQIANNKGVQEVGYSDHPHFAQDNWKNFIVNHCAAIRRSCWEKNRFNEQIFASEDKLWSIEILKKGYSILYNVQNFYLYTKPFDKSTKIKREIIEEAAKELITGEIQPFFSNPYPRSLVTKFISAVKRLSVDLKNHRQVYKGMKEYTGKYKGYFDKEQGKLQE
jgi:glycosyltransferase involved in cell wall biosynthesis